MSISITLSPTELALAQSCVAALPELISTYETAPAMASPGTAATHYAPIPGKDEAEAALRAVMTDPARALLLKLQYAHFNTVLAAAAAAFLPYFNTPLAAQTAAEQADKVLSEAGGATLAYGPVFDAAKVALQRFTEAIS